jgi:hypothetical protein
LMRCFANRTLGSVWKYGNERFQRKMRLQFFRASIMDGAERAKCLRGGERG